MPGDVLITGGCGFIGANLTRLLIKRGFCVSVLDNLSRGYSKYLDGIDVELIKGDIRNRTDIAKALSGDASVVHLAAFGSVVDSVADPTENFDVNVYGTFTLLHMAKEIGVRKIVLASTGGALIGDVVPPVSEHSLPKPISPYGASKLCCEAYAHAFAKSYDLDTICLRFANVYGPYSAHKKGVITQFIRGIRLALPLVIYGDGTATRDFLHVSDLCEGIYLALTSDTSPGDVMHLASGAETCIADIAATLVNLAGQTDCTISYNQRRRGEVERNFASYAYAGEKIGFKPAISLEKGLQDTWEWFVENSSLDTDSTNF